MQTLKVLIDLTPLVNFLTNDNSRCCCTKETKTEIAHHERRIYGSRPAGLDTANLESMDPRRNVFMHSNFENRTQSHVFGLTDEKSQEPLLHLIQTALLLSHIFALSLLLQANT